MRGGLGLDRTLCSELSGPGQYGQSEKGYYKSIGTHHYFIVNEFVVICAQISGAIRVGPNVTF